MDDFVKEILDGNKEIINLARENLKEVIEGPGLNSELYKPALENYLYTLREIDLYHESSNMYKDSENRA